MEAVKGRCPHWRRLAAGIPSEPVVFTAVEPVPVREYEAALLRDLTWPRTTTPGEKAACVRIMATQLLPILREYTQFRDLVQDFLDQMHHWHVHALMPLLEHTENEVRRMMLRSHVQGESLHSPASVAPSEVSVPVSVAESIASAQRTAASLRGQGPAVVFSQPNQVEDARRSGGSSP